jgi:GR25 family glycosyltransferase involved in LPS biosynthesis
MKWQENRKARLAICLSHLSIWKSLIDSIDYTLIIEDDVLLDFDLKEKLNNISSKLTLEWDLLFIGHAGALNGQCMGDITFAKSGNEENSNHGMFAYFVNPKSILKLIKSITPIFKMQHIDWLLRKKYSNDKNGIKAIYFNESIIKHNNDIVSERRLIDKKK